MASVKKGVLTPPRERWRHMRMLKKTLWKRERKAGKLLIREERTDRAE